MTRIGKDYAFEGEEGMASLPGLFGDCRQLPAVGAYPLLDLTAMAARRTGNSPPTAAATTRPADPSFS